MVEPEKREYFRLSVRLPIEFRTVSYEEYLNLENAIKCSTAQIVDSIHEFSFLRDIIANEDVVLRKKGQIYSYLRMIDKKLDIILDHLAESQDEKTYARRHVDVNIGGAGMRFISDIDLGIGVYVELKVILPVLPYPKITALCQVTRSKEVELASDAVNWEIALKFLTINENDRDLLINYLFARERESLRITKKVHG